MIIVNITRVLSVLDLPRKVTIFKQLSCLEKTTCILVQFFQSFNTKYILLLVKVYVKSVFGIFFQFVTPSKKIILTTVAEGKCQ